ncbi:MAG: DUF1460 domain-containing protein, partial [Tannerellaceae bacterium]|nr:DUF1460 domain-containing protein [Tannerellaceae bacterium]
MNRVKYVFLCICLFIVTGVYSQPLKAVYTPADKDIFDCYIEYIQPSVDLPLNEIIIKTAQFFLEVPYVAHTLETEPEQLVINLREMDCTTFIENVLALARTVKGKDPTFDSFFCNLQVIRYRNGEIEDYTSRLHYMTEWIVDNEARGIIKDITKEIGGVPLPVNLFFMSTHPDSYKQLANPDLLQKIKEAEEQVNSQKERYYYVPKQHATQVLDKLKNGDIVLFTTRIEGLDVTHVGFIYKEINKTTFIHASTGAKKVIINQDPLVRYMENVKNNT